MEFKSNNSQRQNVFKIRMDESDYDQDKKDFLSTIDIFDNKLYIDSIQGKSKFDIFQKEKIVKENLPTNSIRFKESNQFYKILLKEKETISNYLFQSSIGLDQLSLKGGYKKKLTKIYKKVNVKKAVTYFEEFFNANEFLIKKKPNSSQKSNPFNKNLGIFENYETQDQNLQNISKKNEAIKINSSYKPPYTSTLNIFGNKLPKKEVLVNEFINSEFNISKDFKNPDDSVFSNRSRIVLKNKFNRPAFVEKLFESYDYNDLDPWKKVQNNTKNKNLCLSVIKDIYNKIIN